MDSHKNALLTSYCLELLVLRVMQGRGRAQAAQEPGVSEQIVRQWVGRIVKVGHRITSDPRDRTEGAGWEYVHVAIDDHSRVG